MYYRCGSMYMFMPMTRPLLVTVNNKHTTYRGLSAKWRGDDLLGVIVGGGLGTSDLQLVNICEPLYVLLTFLLLVT